MKAEMYARSPAANHSRRRVQHTPPSALTLVSDMWTTMGMVVKRPFLCQLLSLSHIAPTPTATSAETRRCDYESGLLDTRQYHNDPNIITTPHNLRWGNTAERLEERTARQYHGERDRLLDGDDQWW